MAPRCFFLSIRRAFAARDGRVVFRGFGLTVACRTKSASRSRAASRFASWLRCSVAVMTRNPSLETRLPAIESNRRRTESGNDRDCATLKRSWTPVSVLLTCCPPGPDDRMNCSSISSSGICIECVMNIMGCVLHCSTNRHAHYAAGKRSPAGSNSIRQAFTI